jgi:hypothetical protein
MQFPDLDFFTKVKIALFSTSLSVFVWLVQLLIKMHPSIKYLFLYFILRNITVFPIYSPVTGEFSPPLHCCQIAANGRLRFIWGKISHWCKIRLLKMLYINITTKEGTCKRHGVIAIGQWSSVKVCLWAQMGCMYKHYFSLVFVFVSCYVCPLNTEQWTVSLL